MRAPALSSLAIWFALLSILTIIPTSNIPGTSPVNTANTRKIVQSSLPVGFTDTVLASFNQETPMDVTWTPDGRLLLILQSGKLYVYKNSAMEHPPALDLAGSTCSLHEMGLIGIAVHPNFMSNHYVYVYYTHRDRTDSRPSVV